jgi:hypothetical protein
MLAGRLESGFDEITFEKDEVDLFGRGRRSGTRNRRFNVPCDGDLGVLLHRVREQEVLVGGVATQWEMSSSHGQGQGRSQGSEGRGRPFGRGWHLGSGGRDRRARASGSRGRDGFTRRNGRDGVTGRKRRDGVTGRNGRDGVTRRNWRDWRNWRDGVTGCNWRDRSGRSSGRRRPLQQHGSSRYLATRLHGTTDDRVWQCD